MEAAYGTLQRPAWTAQWLWVRGESWTANFHAFARKEFRLAEPPTRAMLRVAVSGDYALYVNGRYVARGPMPSEAAFTFYDTHDVTSLLREGENVLAFVLQNAGIGWHGRQKERGGLLAQCDMETAAGLFVVGTDSSWRVLPARCYSLRSPRMFWSARFAETFFGQHVPEGWKEPGFDAAAWEEPLVYGSHPSHPWLELLPRDIPLLTEELQPPLAASRGVFALRGVHVVHAAALAPASDSACEGLFYAATSFHSESDAEWFAHIECDDAFRLRINGEVVAEQNYDEHFARTRTWRGKDDNDQVHYGVGPVGHTVRVRLRAGWNPLLMVVDQGAGGWGLTLAWTSTPDGPVVNLPFEADGQPGRWLLAGMLPTTGLHDSLDNAAEDIAQVKAGERRLLDPFDFLAVTDYATLLRREERKPPTALSPDGPVHLEPGQYVILDLGRVHTGYPELEIVASETGGSVLDLGYSQILRADHRISFSNQGRMKCVDRVYAAIGTLRWQPLHRRTLRYLHISCRGPQGAKVRLIGLYRSLYPVKTVGTFECSDACLNAIWAMSRDTAHLLMQHSYQDCLKREEGTWNTSSFNYASRGAACVFGDVALARSTLRVARFTQERSGWFDSHGLSGLNEDEISECLLWAVWLRDWYLYSGDRAFLEEMWEVLVDNLRFFAKSLNRHGLLDGRNWHLTRSGQSIYLDDVLTYANPATQDVYRGAFPGELSGLNILYFAALQAASEVAAALGYRASARQYAYRAHRVREALRQRLWDPRRHHFADYRSADMLSETGHPFLQIAAVYYGLVTGEERQRILDGLLENMGLPREDCPDYPLMTFNSYFYFLDILLRHGKEAAALELLRRFYGRWMELGATTFGEHFRLSDVRGQSVLEEEYEVHAYGTSALLHFYSHLLGIEPVAAGFSKIRIAPRPGDLRFARGRVPTPHGVIEVAWEIREGCFDLRMEIPGATAWTLELPPSFEKRRVTINGSLLAV